MRISDWSSDVCSSDLLSQGGAIRSTTLTEEFDYERYKASQGGRQTPLFALTPKGYAQPFTPGQDWEPEADWTILSLFPAEVERERVQARREANQNNGN